MFSKIFIVFFAIFAKSGYSSVPIVLNTWNFPTAGAKGKIIFNKKTIYLLIFSTDYIAWESLVNGNSAVTSLVDGCSVCEMNETECGYSVGYGGKPDENGGTTLDAMVYDG